MLTTHAWLSPFGQDKVPGMAVTAFSIIIFFSLVYISQLACKYCILAFLYALSKATIINSIYLYLSIYLSATHFIFAGKSRSSSKLSSEISLQTDKLRLLSQTYKGKASLTASVIYCTV